MADIYKAAVGVTVWLGQASDLKIKNITVNLEHGPNMQWRGVSVLYWISRWSVFARPWWFRQWVFQEVVFARHVWILLGTTYSSWMATAELAGSLRSFETSDRFDEYGVPLKEMNSLFPKLIDVVKKAIANETRIGLLCSSQCWTIRNVKIPGTRCSALWAFRMSSYRLTLWTTNSRSMLS